MHACVKEKVRTGHRRPAMMLEQMSSNKLQFLLRCAPLQSLLVASDTVSAILTPGGGGHGRRAVSMTALCNSNAWLTKWTATVWVASMSTSPSLGSSRRRTSSDSRLHVKRSVVRVLLGSDMIAGVGGVSIGDDEAGEINSVTFGHGHVAAFVPPSAKSQTHKASTHVRRCLDNYGLNDLI